MTNLTSEQFRDILHNLEGYTVETPSVQNLLRRAVETFYSNFGCYPEAAGASPGSGSLFGEQVQFDEGLTFSVPTPMATVVVARKVPGFRVTVVTTADVGKPKKVCFGLSECPLAVGGPVWVNYIKAVMAIYCCRRTVTAFEAAVETSLPLGVGFGSSAALEIAMFTLLEVLFGKKVHPTDKAIACQYAEEDFFHKKAGIAARMCASVSRDRHAVLIDTMTAEVDWIPFRNREVVLVGVDCHCKDTLFGGEYPERTKYLKKACEILGVENLRSSNIEDLAVLEERIRGVGDAEEEGSERKTLIDDEWTEDKLEVVLKRVRFYVTEMKRIEEATEAWREGDVRTFGQKMTESHFSLKEDFGFSNPLLEFLVETSLEAEGVLGSKMIGLGLDRGGCVLTLVYKENLRQYCEYLRTSFVEHEAELTQAFKEKLASDLAEQNGAEGKEETVAGDALVEEAKGQADQAYRADQPGNVLAASQESDAVLPVQVIEEETVTVKRKKKCDPSKKRKKRMERDERLLSLSEGEEAERKRKEEQEAAEELKGQEKEGVEGARAEDVDGPVALESATKEEEEGEEEAGEGKEGKEEEQEITLELPSFYIINPVAGARMLFPLKNDLLRSRYARRIPQAKELVKNACDELYKTFQRTPEAIGLAPATTTLFGEFLEYNMGYVISMALPLATVTLGCRNDGAFFRLKTTSTEVGEQTEFRSPLPCTGHLDIRSESWIEYAGKTVSEFKGHVPGFEGVVESSVPCEIGLHSCSAFQASIYEFLEGLTGTCTADPLEKADRCRRASDRSTGDQDPLLSKCSTLRLIPTFLSREGYVILVNTKNLKMANYYLDHPSYAFLLACCKERSSTVTVNDLGDRIRLCRRAAEILGKDSLINADEGHVRCLRKRGATEEMVRRARYVITEQQRCAKAIEAIKRDDYENLGVLMTQSHCSLRDDFGISAREIEVIVNLALSVEGVLGAKLVGKGLTSTVLILAKLSSADNCIKHVRKNYQPRRDKPFFYLFRPSSGAFIMNSQDYKLIP